MNKTKQYGKTVAEAKKLYGKYKETDNEKFKHKANRKFAEAEAIAIELGSNKTTINNISLAYKSNNQTTTNTLSNNKLNTKIDKKSKNK